MLVSIQNLLKITDEKPPISLSAWLGCQTSLTSKLYALTGEANLEVLKQNWRQPNTWEQAILGLHSEPLLAREIMIFSHNKPYWYGRTMIPYTTYKLNEALFSRLKQESLGDLIYDNPDIKRLMLFNYSIDKQCMEYHWLPTFCQADSELWLRLSIFTINDSFFSLIEILLPELEGIE